MLGDPGLAGLVTCSRCDRHPPRGRGPCEETDDVRASEPLELLQWDRCIVSDGDAECAVGEREMRGELVPVEFRKAAPLDNFTKLPIQSFHVDVSCALAQTIELSAAMVSSLVAYSSPAQWSMV